MATKGFKCVKGVRDILPPEIDVWKFVEKTWEEFFLLYGFKEIRIPIFEYTNLFQRGIGEATDIVEKEMYTFLDKSGNSITLRPEGTAPVVRAYVEHNLHRESPFNKFYYMGPMFRYERPQKGRYRQFYQIGVEVFDDNSPEVEVETLEMINLALKKLGFKKYTLYLNSIGCSKCRPEFIKILKENLTKRKDELCNDCKRRIDTNPLRVLDCKNEMCKRVVRDMPKITENLCEDCKAHHTRLKNLLEKRGIEFSENHLLVRGIDYYIKTTFEVVVENLGAQNAVLGGGRYDGLIKELGGPDISGFGFALGLDRMVLSLGDEIKNNLKNPPDFYLAYLGDEVLEYSFKVAKIFRENGFSIYTNFKGRSLKSHLRLANKLNSKFVILIGENEMKDSKIIVKDMKESNQREIKFEEINSFINEIEKERKDA